jgi:beta-glucosidase
MGRPAGQARLPADFRFGAATAAFQIEGAVHEDGRGESIWDRFAHTPGRVHNGDHGDVACEHYRRWPEDLDVMAGLGLDGYRFSIAWPRVMPSGSGAPNQVGLDFYRRLAEGLRERGIEPLATLYHWDLPQALQDAGGWARRDTVERFTEYALAVYERLGDVVAHWITINEPWVVAFAGHAYGTKAPGLTDWATAVKVSHHVNLAHGRAVQALRQARPGAEVGTSLNLAPIHPATDSDADRDAARRLDGNLNRWFLDATVRGAYPADMLELYERKLGRLDFIRPGDLELIASPTDFLGVNYYRPFSAHASDANEVLGVAEEPARPPVTAMGWEVRPDGLSELLRRIRNGYGNPRVLITENGACYDDPPARNGTVDDPERLEYLRGHLTAVREAIAGGANVRGYYVWSLLDNFEWEHGYAKRFGIVHVDYRTQRRTLKASARWYRDHIASSRDGEITDDEES